MRSYFINHKGIKYGILILIIGVALGYGIAIFFSSKTNENTSSIEERRQSGYQFVSPLLIANPTNEFVPLENVFKQDTFDSLNSPDVYTISIYFQDLNSGQWAGVNENGTYNPASLLKVPIMIAYFKEAENDPSILSEEFPYQTEPLDSTSTEFDTLKPGQDYTVDDLIKAMIVGSDNGAKYTLLKNINVNVLLDVFTSLGIQSPDVSNYVISDIDYARFFKILYNSTYLDADMSEKAMELLTQATFKQGIVAGIPSGIPVAHKFGQYTGPGEDTNVASAWELGDCGVIYYPNKPYLLCVMTRGADLTTLEGVVQTISKAAYTEVSNNYH